MGFSGGKEQRVWQNLLCLFVLSACVGDSDGAPANQQSEPRPCVSLSDLTGAPLNTINFGSLGSTEARRTVRARIENCDQEGPLRIENSRIKGAPGFFIQGLERQKRLIEAGGAREVELVFGAPKGSEPGLFEAIWTLETASKTEKVPLKAQLWDCPDFRLEAYGPGADQEGRMVISSRESPEAKVKILVDKPYHGEFLRWEWEVSAAPSLVANFQAGADGLSGRLLPKMPGYYGINAVGVHREEGVICLPEPRESLGVHNAVGADVMVVLSWEEEVEKRPLAHPGYELHYRNREGFWRSRPWDVSSENQQADWGAGGVVEMSHRAFLGGRWESIIHFEPRVGEVIDVGAQLLSSPLPGAERPIGVRAQIFIQGEEVLNLQRPASRGWRGWHIAQIRWPSVQKIDQVYRDLWDVR